jgi:hypothetical protein
MLAAAEATSAACVRTNDLRQLTAIAFLFLFSFQMPRLAAVHYHSSLVCGLFVVQYLLTRVVCLELAGGILA